MSRDLLWAILAIEPTNDRSAIRRAYASRLKAIDVDRDPDAYIALRGARDDALRGAAHGWWASEDPAASSADDVGLVFDADAAGVEAEPAAGVDALLADSYGDEDLTRQSAEPDVYDEHAMSLHALLLSGTNEALHADQQDAALGHLRAILSDPRLEDISFFARAEDWIADLLARSIPRSDPLLRPASDALGWTPRADAIDLGRAAAFVTRRLRTLDFLSAVEQPDHRLYRAWLELNAPTRPKSRRGWRVRREHVNELLAALRRDHPELEDRFDPHRVALWETRHGIGTSPWLNIALAAMIVALIVCAQLGITAIQPVPRRPTTERTTSPPQVPEPAPHPSPTTRPVEPFAPPPPPKPALLGDDEPREIDAALTVAFGDWFQLRDIQGGSGKLDDVLHHEWSKARDAKLDVAGLAGRLRPLLLDRVSKLPPPTEGELLVEHGRIMLEKAKLLQARSAELCDRMFQGKLGAGEEALLDPLKRRRLRLIVRMLIELEPIDRSAAVPVTGSGRFTIQPEVVDDAVRRAGLDRDKLLAALIDEGTASERCAARIALLETALALPAKERDALLVKL